MNLQNLENIFKNEGVYFAATQAIKTFIEALQKKNYDEGRIINCSKWLGEEFALLVILALRKIEID